MSKRARMKEQEKRRQERERQKGRKHSSSYLKGPKPPGPNSPIYEVRHVEISGSDDSDVVAEPSRPRSAPYEPHRYVESGPVILHAPSSLESHIDLSSLPPLPADGGVELLLYDGRCGEFVLVGGVHVDARLSALSTLSSTVFIRERNARLAGIDRYFVYGAEFYGDVFTLADLFEVPGHRVRSRAQFESWGLEFVDFAISSLPSDFQHAQAYVAQALKEAAEHDARVIGTKSSASPSASPASAYVPLDPDPSGIYCVLHNRDSDFLYVFLDPRTLPGASSGTAVAARRFFEERINSDQFPPELQGILLSASLPFEFVDPYRTDGISVDSGLHVLRDDISIVFGAPQHRILSFLYDEPHDIEFEDLAMDHYHPQLRDLVIKYTDLARKTGQTLFP